MMDRPDRVPPGTTDGGRPAEPERVEVDVADLRSATRAVRWLIVWSVVLSVAVGLALNQVSTVNAAQDRADRREAHEDELEQAQVCVDDHVGYGAFEPLLLAAVEAAARVGADAHLRLTGATPDEVAQAHQLIVELMPAELGPLFEAFPPPSCDYEEAVRVLEAG